MTEQQNDPPIDNVPEEELQDEEEYSVEAIRGKRKNPKTGLLEYLIKWENYPETANTWEPVDNLKCPDLICKFHEQEKAKRKRKSVNESQPKRPKTTNGASTSQAADQLILAEDELENGSTTDTLSSTNEQCQQEVVDQAPPRPRGFERGLPIEEIVGSCTDDDDKLWFFIKWVGANDLELVDGNELEEKAPRDLCLWYKERLYFNIKTGNEKTPTRITNDQVRVR